MTDVEKEEAIAKEWEFRKKQGWSMSRLSKSLGRGVHYVEHILASRTVAQTVPEAAGLPSSIRQQFGSCVSTHEGREVVKTVAKAISSGSVPRDVQPTRDAIKIVPKLAPPVRKALAEGKIDLDQAEDIAAVPEEAQKELLGPLAVGERATGATAGRRASPRRP
jgi:hypothetical protein